MKTKLALGFLLLVTVLLAADVKCPLDNGTCYFTGKVTNQNGYLFHEYRCPQGHLYWVRQ